MRLIFLLPVLSGLSLLVGSLVLFRKERLDPRNFAIAILLSGLVVISPLIYTLLNAVKDFFGFVYTFVFAFGLAILFLIALAVYLILSIGALRDETETLWQEIALMRTEIEHREDDVMNGDD